MTRCCLKDGLAAITLHEIIEQMRASVHTHTGIALDDVGMITADVPASWVLEGGEIMPEPGEEAEWLAKHGHHAPAE